MTVHVTAHPLLRTSLLAALLAGALSACVPVALVGGAVSAGTLLASADRRSGDTQQADRQIEASAQEDLVTFLNGRGHVNVASYYRKALITGEVPSEQDRQAVEARVRAVQGVEAVINELAVMPESTPWQRSNDALITSRVRARLVGANGVPAGSIKVLTERGTTYIMGRLTPLEAQLSTDLVAQTEGVLRVVRVIDLIADPATGRMTPAMATQVGSGTAPAAGDGSVGDGASGVQTHPVTQPSIEPMRQPVQVQTLPPLQ